MGPVVTFMLIVLKEAFTSRVLLTTSFSIWPGKRSGAAAHDISGTGHGCRGVDFLEDKASAKMVANGTARSKH